ncbi:MAG TPA: DUF4010 domain-containing protein [Candidatus Acetothermia bacterium]|nr:DUF4010 domain-containing protein [Candidatus Acetothermia bacterium]
MVVLVAGVGFAGYVLMKLLGPGKGIGVTGLLGGLLSSTAVTLSFAHRGRGGVEPVTAARAIVAAGMANAAVKGAMVLVLGGGSLRRAIAPALGGMLVAGIGLAFVR